MDQKNNTGSYNEDESYIHVSQQQQNRRSENIRKYTTITTLHTTRQLQNMTGFVRANERNQPRTSSTPLTREQILNKILN